MKKYNVILVPGLNDGRLLIPFFWTTKFWGKQNVYVTKHIVPWAKKESFDDKLQRLLDVIDLFTLDGSTVSLMGFSAGGSLVVSAYAKRKGKIDKVINVCGRVQSTKAFTRGGRYLHAYKESVHAAMDALETLSLEEKKRILTIRPLYDAVVPVKTVSIAGANNIAIPSIFHVPSMAGMLLFGRKKMISFIQKPN